MLLYVSQYCLILSYIFSHVFWYFCYIFLEIFQYVQIGSNICGSREHGIIIPIGIPCGAFFSALLVVLPLPGHKSAKALALAPGDAIPTSWKDGGGSWCWGSVTPASKELRRRGCILIWSNDRGCAPALKHCAGAHKMDGLVVTSKLQALKQKRAQQK